MRAVLISAMASLLASGAWAQNGQVDLNAPIVQAPTLGSEIKRGFDAGFGCSITLEPFALSRCISAIASKEEREKSDAVAFAFGVYVGGWLVSDTALQSAEKLTDNPLAVQRAKQLRGIVGGQYAVLRDYQKKLGLTDEQVFSATRQTGDKFKARLAYWATQPDALAR